MAFLRFLVLLATLLAACTTASPAGSPSLAPTASPTPQPAAYPLTLTDDAGRAVTIAAEPQRIVSLAPSNTEIACAIGRCDRVVGVTNADDYPAEVVDLPEVVIYTEVDVEAVVAADPDLVLAAGNELTSSEVISQLSTLGLTVLVLYPAGMEELYADIILVGRALAAEPAATTLVADMQERVAAVEAAVADVERPRTFYEVGVYQGVIYTAGEGSFIADLLELAGAEPITGDPVTTAIELEALVTADPELILLGDAAYDASITPAAVAERPGWSDMTAVRDGRIVIVLADPVITRPGPRIVDGLEALAAVIHPELFAD